MTDAQLADQVFANFGQASVAARNAANHIANEIEAEIREAFRPLVGEKIQTAYGSLTKQAAAMLEPWTKSIDYPQARIYNSRSNYTLGVEIQTRREYRHGYRNGTHDTMQAYGLQYVYIGNIQDQILVKIGETEHQRRTDWTVEEIASIVDQIEKAEQNVRTIEAQLAPDFDRRDAETIRRDNRTR